MASFFGIQNWFHRNITDLSGGQKQLLNLASIMVMQPSVLILDEPTSGVCLGAEAGFFVGAVTGFVSNFFFGQGPWTPWQMFCFGIIGFLAGILFAKGLLNKTKISLCIFGGLATFLIYGGIINIAALLMFTSQPSWKALLATYISGFWFDMVHAIATVVFLYLISQPMIEKLDRIKIKYGLIEP